MYRGKYSSKTRNFQQKNQNEAKSQASEAEFGRRYSDYNGAKASMNMRPKTAGGNGSAKSGNRGSQKKLTIGSSKKFYPVEYFRRVGYQYDVDQPPPITQENVQNMMQAQRQDLIIRLDKDEKFRFNEDFVESQRPSKKGPSTIKSRPLKSQQDLENLSQPGKGTKMNTNL